MFWKKETGQSAEDRAAEYLGRNGYRVLERNVRLPMGEIDLVARQGDVTCFVEVRSRSQVATHEAALESVGFRKRAKLRQLALAYLKNRGWLERPARFDVVSVRVVDGQSHIALIRDAFGMEELQG